MILNVPDADPETKMLMLLYLKAQPKCSRRHAIVT